MKHSPFVITLLLFVMAVFVGSEHAYANSFRRDKTNTSSNPGWPMNVDASLWPAGVSKTQAHADSINNAHQTFIATHHQWTTNGDPKYIDAIKVQNPNFGWYEYNSFQDNYVTGDTQEHDWLVSQCKALGVNPERLYMHYYDATTMSLQGVSLTFPGTKNAKTLTDTVNSRIPIYYNDRSRIVVNMSDATTRLLTKKYACVTINTLNTQSGGTYTARNYVDGIFWDNSQPPFWNYGTVISGGHVAENPVHTRVDSIGLRGTNWWWTSGMQPFFNSLMDTLKLSTSWAKDGKRKKIVINTSGTIYDPMALDTIANYFGHEGGYSPLRTYITDIQSIYRWDSLCAAHGVGIVYANPIYTDLSGYAGTYSYAEALYSNLCLFYVTSSDSAWFSPIGASGPWLFDWTSKIWCGAMDYDIGPHNLADRKYSIAATGTDPKGYSYTVFSRNYPRAKVFIRPRGRYDQDIDAATAVTISLGGSYREVRPDGTTGSTVTSFTLRNGQGKMFVPATAGSDNTPPADIKDLSAIAGPSNGSIALTWTSPGDDDMTGKASYYVIKYSPDSLTVTSWEAAPSLGNPPAPQAGGVTQQAVISGLPDGRRYYIGVRAVDDQGNTGGLSNEAISFSRGIQSPNLDTFLVDKATQSVQLRVYAVSAYVPVAYEYQMDTTDNFTSSQTTVDTSAGAGTESSASFNHLQENVRYYWRCRAVARDGSLTSPWSLVGTFIPYFGVVSGGEDYQVKVQGPLAGAVVETPQPTLAVENIARNGQNVYFFEVAADSLFRELTAASPALPQQDNGATSWQVSEPLESGRLYYWRAKVNGYRYSAVASFSVRSLAHAFPNPVHLATGDRVTFTGVPPGANLSILTLSGELVRRWANLPDGDLIWNATNESGHQIASGTYLWYIEDSNIKGKLIVIR